MPIRPIIVLVSIVMIASITGCETTGITERKWNECYAALEIGLKPVDLLTSLGDPREIRPIDPVPEKPETWIYTRPERVDRITAKTGENDIPLPNGKGTVTVPVYEDQDVIKIVEYHLVWNDQRLQSWARIVTR